MVKEPKCTLYFGTYRQIMAAVTYVAAEYYAKNILIVFDFYKYFCSGFPFLIKAKKMYELKEKFQAPTINGGIVSVSEFFLVYGHIEVIT